MFIYNNYFSEQLKYFKESFAESFYDLSGPTVFSHGYGVELNDDEKEFLKLP